MRQEGKRRPSREEEAEEALKGVKKEAKDILKVGLLSCSISIT